MPTPGNARRRTRKEFLKEPCSRKEQLDTCFASLVEEGSSGVSQEVLISGTNKGLLYLTKRTQGGLHVRTCFAQVNLVKISAEFAVQRCVQYCTKLHEEPLAVTSAEKCRCGRPVMQSFA